MKHYKIIKTICEENSQASIVPNLAIYILRNKLTEENVKYSGAVNYFVYEKHYLRKNKKMYILNIKNEDKLNIFINEINKKNDLYLIVK
jgi:hypothetical protein